MKPPESISFLRSSRWLVYIAGVCAVFTAGALASQHLLDGDGHKREAAGAHGAPDQSAGHDHTASATLRPLMQQMLVDSLQLQGALSDGDFTRAATHADAIAKACDEGDSEPLMAPPDDLGPSFFEHDRALHASASRLSQALRSGRHSDARTLSRSLVLVCQSCHRQAPAASHVDLRVLTSFANGLANPATSPSRGL